MKVTQKTYRLVPKRATKLIISLKNFHIKKSLRRLNLPTLEYRRLRRDMIEVFKIINASYQYRNYRHYNLILQVLLEAILSNYQIFVFIMT